MPVTKVNTPNGVISVDHPEGATQEQIFAFAKKQIDSQPVDFSASEMVGNIPSSAAQYGRDIASAVTSPIETLKSMGSLSLGAAQLAGDYVSGAIPQPVKDAASRAFPSASLMQGVPDTRDYARQVGGAIEGRYGGIDQAKQTLMNDPVGALADVSGLLAGGGALAARLPGIMGKVGAITQKVGVAADPINAAVVAPGKLAGRGLMSLVPETLPRNLYLHAAKFPPKLKDRDILAETALREGIMPTTSGLGKLNTIKSGLINEIDSLISQATEAGARVPRAAVYRYLNQAREQVGGPRIRAKKNLKQIDDIAKEFDTYMNDIGMDSLSPKDLQKFKKSIYKEGKYDAKSLTSGVGTDAALKQLGRAAKESIEGVADVGPLNDRLGSLLALEEPISGSAGRIQNLNMVGIGAPIKLAAGQAVGGTLGAGAAAVQSIFEMPKVKSKLAMILKRAQEGGKISPFEQSLLRTMAQQGLLQGGRLEPIASSPQLLQ